MRILIVEDDLTSRKFLSSFLSQYGQCDVVVDGLEALEAFLISIKDQKLYELICLDIMMPRVDGVAVLKGIKDLEKKKNIPPEKHVKVVVTTALNDKEYVQKAMDIGCDAFAFKPINTEELVETLKKIGLIKDSCQGG
jgi:two-component system, chemotaxis family, chemotaxis protein CheY